jgi:glycine/D-amino acid oxidase-like deaminating enzyme
MDIPSFWRETAPPVPATDGPLPAATDVLVIGAGLSGLSVARRLSEAGRDVVVVDRVGIGGGASARNGGIVAPGLVDGMTLGLKRYGRENATALLHMTWRSLDIIRDVEAQAPFPIELELPGRLTLARDREELAALHENARLLNEAGERVRHAEREDVPAPLRDVYLGGIILEGGFVHSGRLTMAFGARAMQAGAQIHAPYNVGQVERSGRGFVARADGNEIRAREVVLATNGFTSRVLPRLPIAPQRGQMMVTEPLAPVLTYAMSARQGFDYFHQRKDGRLVAGGYRDLDLAAEATDEMVLNEGIQAALTRLATTVAGRPPKVLWRWSCIMGFTPDHLPIAGQVEEGLYITAGFSGHGVVMAPTVGRSLAEAMLGMDGPELALFSPARPSLREPPL